MSYLSAEIFFFLVDFIQFLYEVFGTEDSFRIS